MKGTIFLLPAGNLARVIPGISSCRSVLFNDRYCYDEVAQVVLRLNILSKCFWSRISLKTSEKRIFSVGRIEENTVEIAKMNVSLELRAHSDSISANVTSDYSLFCTSELQMSTVCSCDSEVHQIHSPTSSENIHSMIPSGKFPLH